MSLWSPLSLIFTLALSAGALAENNDDSTQGIVSDANVDLESSVKFEQHFEPWVGSLALQGKITHTAKVIAGDLAGAWVSAGIMKVIDNEKFSPLENAERRRTFLDKRVRIAQKNTENIKQKFLASQVDSQPRFGASYQFSLGELRATQAAQKKAALNYSLLRSSHLLAKLGVIYFIADATTGTVISMRGYKPVFVGNLPAAAIYLARTEYEDYLKTPSENSGTLDRELEYLLRSTFGTQLETKVQK